MVPSSVVALLGYPIGILMAKVIPHGIFNPGPFTIKEHALLTVLASAAGGVAYGIDNVASQHLPELMNDERINLWNSLAFILSSQLIGFGMSGLTRRFLIRPPAMLWPSNLPNIALFVSFHKKSSDEEEVNLQYPMSRYRMFWLVLAGIFIYTFIPNYFVTSLQAISILCLFTTSKTARLLFSSGISEGPGIGAISLDWSSISSMGPMTSPWWAAVNYYAAAA